jgi:hypothetical protein
VHGLEHRREVPFGVDVARGSDSDTADDGRADVGEDVAEEVRGDDDVELRRGEHELRSEGVDVVLARVHIGILGGDVAEHLVPEGHRVDDAVRFGRRGEVPATTLREAERVAHRAFDADAREHRFLNGDLLRSASIEPASDLGVLALIVLPDDEEVDRPRDVFTKGAGHAWKERDGAQIDVLLERATDGDEKTPERDVVRNLRRTDGTEEDLIEVAQLIEAVRRHHAPVLRVVRARPVELGPLDPETEERSGPVQDRCCRGDDFPADAIAGNSGDAVIASHMRVCSQIVGVWNAPQSIDERASRLSSGFDMNDR